MTVVERPNTRMGAVKRYLSRVPKEAAVLQLTVAQSADSLMLLGEWPADEVRPEIAEEILLLMEEHSETMRASITGQLGYVTEGGQRVGSQRVLRQQTPSMADGESDAGMWSTPAQLTGESQAQAAQAQRHLEVMTKMVFTAMGMLCSQMKGANEHVLELCEVLATRLSESEQRSRESIQRAENAEEWIREQVAAAASDDTQESSEAQDRVMKLLEPLIPMVMAAMAGGGGGGSPPAKTVM